MKNILITGIGGGGSNNLYESLLQSKLNIDDYIIYGSNISKEVLAKSQIKENFLLPVATSPKYKAALIKLIKEQGIDLIIPNNDREVGVISEIREELPCKVFLPDKESVKFCQDKHEMYLKLKDHGIPMAHSYEIKSLEDIKTAMDKIGGEKFWIRPKVGAGSKGATWVKNYEQAVAWVNLWIELRGFKLENFTVSEFLPGRDFCFQSVWKDGELVLAKMCERMSYFGGENRLSGMSSTPAVAKTIRDEKALEVIFKSVKLLTSNPHGNFNFDLKGRENGEMCITECNVGRFCMITPIFDRTGKHSTAEYYVRAAFDDVGNEIEDPIDIEEDNYMLRELDTLPTIINEKMINELIKKSYVE